MIGIIFFCLIVAAVLAEKTREIVDNKESKERAIKKQKVYYFDNHGAKRSVENNEPLIEMNWGCGKTYVSANDHNKIIYDEGQKFLDSFNNEPYMKYTKGKYGFVYRYFNDSKIVLKRELFYFDKENNRPYIVISYNPQDENNTLNSIKAIAYFKNDIVPDCVSIDTNGEFLYSFYKRSFNIDFDNLKEISKEEINYYYLKNAYKLSLK